MVTDQSQAVIWQTEQTPFGEVTQTTGTLAQPLRFPGQYADPETGYSYNYFRDYDPSVGRYVQSDPIGLRGGLNTYGYVYQNPLIRIDPFGLDSLICRGNRRECLTQTGGRGNIMLPGLPALPLCPTNGGMYNENDNEVDSAGGNNNPYLGPVDGPVIVVDGNGNAIPVEPGESVNSSPNGDYQQVIGADGRPTGDRLDRGGHRNQSDPRAQGPHGHRPGVTTPDGNPHLPIYQ
jgi:RHS repeat-associated protein